LNDNTGLILINRLLTVTGLTVTGLTISLLIHFASESPTKTTNDSEYENREQRIEDSHKTEE